MTECDPTSFDSTSEDQARSPTPSRVVTVTIPRESTISGEPITRKIVWLMGTTTTAVTVATLITTASGPVSSTPRPEHPARQLTVADLKEKDYQEFFNSPAFQLATFKFIHDTRL